MSFVVPEKAATHFHLRLGDVVGDFGVGSGAFIPALARAVGTEGKVYVFDIQKALVERAAAIAKEQGFSTVAVVWCDIEAENGCKLADGTLDAAVLANVLFQFENKKAGLREIRRLLRKGGKLFIIDWQDSFGGMGPKPEEVVPEEDVKMLSAARGFQFVRAFSAGKHHYGLAFRAV